MKQKVIVIVGPTASGKTTLSIELAKKIKGEIISADSMQIYKEMNIGTAKPSIKEMQGIRHYLIDFISPEERFTVSNYKDLAEKAIKEILDKGETPIIVGGTGLYINSLIYNIEYGKMDFDKKYREELEKISIEKGNKYIYDIAKEIDEEAIKNISINDKKRIIRILEIYKATGKNKTQMEIESRKNKVPFNYKVFGIYIEREKLYDRINKRVDMMLKEGLIEEVEEINRKYKKFPTAMQAIGYKEVVEYLENKLTKEEMIEKIKMETRRYAKRQITWFKRNKEIKWLDGMESIQNNVNIILEECCERR